MAYYESTRAVTLRAGEDLSAASIGSALKMNAEGRVILATAVTDIVIGVLGESGNASGTEVPVIMLGGILKMVCNSAIVRGNLVGSAAKGAATPAGRIADIGDSLDDVTGNAMALGLALEAGAAGEVISVLAMPIFKSA